MDPTKNTLDNELYHYGVKNMRWGIQNGPPYPLNAKGKAALKKQGEKPLNAKKESRKKSRVEKAKAKAKLKAEKKKLAEEKRRKAILNDPSKLYKNRKQFTKEEIDEAMKQFEWEKKLKQLSVDDIRLGSEKAKYYLDYAGKIVGGYNLFAQVYNAFRDPEDKALPYISKDEKKK